MVYLKRKIIIAPVGIILLLVMLFAYKTGRTVTIIGGNSEQLWEETALLFPALPEREEDRTDVLIVGIRGFSDDDDDIVNGGSKGEYLADTIILLSFNKKSEVAALISIPRDLYVDIPQYGMEKINSAYAIGETRNYGGGGLQLIKALVSVISGVYVDHAISIDFAGFQKIVDHLGGIVIYRDTPFVEDKQWIYDGRAGGRYWRLREQSTTTPAGWVFSVPKGSNVMSSEESLYYARSRYSSSDFDRMRRQQEVISAIKSKALNLGVLTSPIKIFQILDTVEKNVRTDMSASEMKELIDLARDAKIQDFKKAVFSSDEDSVLREDNIDERFVLVPKAGDYSSIQELFYDIVK